MKHNCKRLNWICKTAAICFLFVHEFITLQPLLSIRHLCLDELGLDDLLKSLGISSELGDTLTELLNRHLVLVEVEAEERLIVEVRLLLDVQGVCGLSLQLLWDGVLGVLELLQKVWCDGEVIAAGKLGDLTDTAERGPHDDGLVAELLVVVEDGLDGLDTWVLLLGVLLLGGGLVPVENAADEWGDEEGVGLGGGDGLDEGEHEGQVAVDAVLLLEDAGGLDTLPGGGDLNENALLWNTEGLVELENELGSVN